MIAGERVPAHPIMLDVDTGVDDALAIALALRTGANIVGITSVAGNVPVELATVNTRRVLAWMGAEAVPVYRGASRPLAVDHVAAAHVHGDNGLGGAEPGDSPVAEADASGVDAILRNASMFDGELVLVALGPLTNIAMALSLRPELTRQLRRLVIMGGAFSVPGNFTPHAEFNAFVDPHACAQVMEAEWGGLVAVGLDVTHQTALMRDQWQGIPDNATGAAGLARAITARTFTERKMEGFYLHDPVAVAVAMDPELIETFRKSVSVIVDGDHRGKTVMGGEGNVAVATAVDTARFGRMFAEQMGIPLPSVNDARGRCE